MLLFIFTGEILHQNPRFGHTIGGEPFYEATVNDANGNKSVIFSSPTFCRNLAECPEMHLDGTFKIVPRQPAAYQLLTVMVIQYGHVSNIILLLHVINNGVNAKPS